MVTPVVPMSPSARPSYLALFSIRRSFSTSTSRHSSEGRFRRSDFTGQGFTGYYEPGGPTVGPLGEASVHGAPKITPKALKTHLDKYVVGQERAKKILSVAVYNHYQRIQELRRREHEEEELIAQQERSELRAKHPVEGRPTVLDPDFVDDRDDPDEFPGQQTTHFSNHPTSQNEQNLGAAPLIDNAPFSIEKSNVLLLGPSGVGKTHIAKTLARVLEVPFSMSDCTPFTQAGYIGEDVEVCIQRLLAAANYDVARAEHGIICLDEVDKIATAKVSHGKDVSGEGVQQALLKIIEGTTVQVQAKQERSSSTSTRRNHNSSPAGGSQGGSSGQMPSKGETYNVQTDNILFICTGAFIGLHKTILDRIARGSIGFGAQVRASPISGDSTDPLIRSDQIDKDFFRKHLPFFAPTSSSSDPSSSYPPQTDTDTIPHSYYNTLDLVESSDLQKYGLIPELIGRIPITCALSSLSIPALVRVLTEPRNSLLSQYIQLLQLSGVELRFTTGALHQVAKTASGMGTGARGLRSVMERLLSDVMFETPGSLTKHVLMTEKGARREEAPRHYAKGQQDTFFSDMAAEEEQWERRKGIKSDKEGANTDAGAGDESADAITFEQYREKAKVAGSG